MDPHTASFVKRARMSAVAGPYLFGIGAAVLGIGFILDPPRLVLAPMSVVMGLFAILMQAPRQRGWLHKSDRIEMLCLASMPAALGLLIVLWLMPNDALSIGAVLQGLGGFFSALGLFHIINKQHTLALADEIERRA